MEIVQPLLQGVVSTATAFFMMWWRERGQSKARRLSEKRQLVGDLMAYRSDTTSQQFLAPFNKALVVFHSAAKVKDAFDQYLNELNTPVPVNQIEQQEMSTRRRELLISLIFEMAQDAKINELSREVIQNVYLPVAKAIDAERTEIIKQNLLKLLTQEQAIHIVSHIPESQFNLLVGTKTQADEK